MKSPCKPDARAPGNDPGMLIPAPKLSIQIFLQHCHLYLGAAIQLVSQGSIESKSKEPPRLAPEAKTHADAADWQWWMQLLRVPDTLESCHCSSWESVIILVPV